MNLFEKLGFALLAVLVVTLASVSYWIDLLWWMRR
jgi:hypothetical protein